jgi:dTDP-4-amino-4,6-dideoxygalactose transaminase
MTMKVPFLDLVAQHAALKVELMQVFEKAIDTAGFVGGPLVENLEREFAAFSDTTFCVGVASGTDALRFALAGAGVKAGDTVVTVPLTFIATSEAISQVGAHFDLVDVDESTCTLCPAKLREYLDQKCAPDPKTGKLLSKRTGSPVTAIVPVHLYGQPADMDPILELAQKHNLIVIEDACQAHGAEYFSQKQSRWLKCGSMGAAAAFSFYPGKNLGACGEAGAITTNDEGIARFCRMVRDHGQSKKYYHDIEGYNGRLDAIQAGLLSMKLRHLARWNELRRSHARKYAEMLKPVADVVRPVQHPQWARSVYHLYVVRVPDRDQMIKDLNAAGIGTGIHYPIPLHQLKAYASLGYRAGDFPVAEKTAASILSLPMFAELTEEQQRHVCDRVMESVGAPAPSGR